MECSPGCPRFLLGDGVCYEACNTKACQNDGGDCCFESAVTQEFELSSWGGGAAEVLPDMSIPLERFVGRKNRLIAGILLTQTRMKTGACSAEKSTIFPASWNLQRLFEGAFLQRFLGDETGDAGDAGETGGGSRFSSLYEECLTEVSSTDPFGVDAVFLPAAALYDPTVKIADHYSPTTTDANIFNGGGLPYAFRHLETGSDRGLDGFHAFFDINFSNERAMKVWNSLLQGFYFDSVTKDVQLTFVTYNGHTSSFCSTAVTFSFEESGTIMMSHHVNAFSSAVYSSSDDFVRLCLEVAFMVMCVVSLGSEMSEIVVTKIETGKFSTYFASLWNYIDIANLLLFFYSAALWVGYVRALSFYSPQERWEVLKSLQSEGNFMELQEADAKQFLNFLEDTKELVEYRARQNFVNGVALLLVILRLLKNLDFQPRLGLVTRTLQVIPTQVFFP